MGEVDVKVRAEGSPTRCPYCHEDVAREKEAWVACEACLARHHAGCWQEGGRCGGCGGGTFIAREAPARATVWQGEPAAEDEVPSTEVELRGRRAHFELDPEPLLLVARPGVEVEEFELRVKNETGLPQRVEVRRLPAWIVPLGEAAYEIPAGATARFRLGFKVADAPREHLPRGQQPQRAHLGAGGISTASLVLSCDEDSAQVPMQVQLPHTRAQLAVIGGLLGGLVAHVGVVFWLILLAKTWTAPTREKARDGRDFQVKSRQYAQALRMRRAIGIGLAVVLAVSALVLLTVALLKAFG